MYAQLTHYTFFHQLKKQYQEQQIKKLIGQFDYELRNKRETVFKQGDIGDKFYIILKGSVYILTDTIQSKQQEAQARISSIDNSFPIYDGQLI